MALHVTTIHNTADVVALRIAGTAEERPLLRLIDAIEAAAEGRRGVVLDLDQLVIVSAGPIQSFTAQLVARVGEERVVLSCRRYPCNARHHLPTIPSPPRGETGSGGHQDGPTNSPRRDD